MEVFTNSFSYHSDDYFHKNTGSLFGVIQVSDHSKNSEYIPNLLTSIIKKTFYSHSKKTTEENFELALKKANLALADLAEHDIVEWNKNLHAIVGVFDKNTLLFAQVGDALISIGRDNQIMNLSEPDHSTTSHPIKTFKDVVIGEVQSGDKIIIATPTIIDIFNDADLNRLFSTFSIEEFDSIFFKTLEKEGENISAVVVNVEKKEEVDYSESAALDNEDISIEELTKNTNFLGDTIKSGTKDSSNTKLTTKQSNKKSTGRIKKTTSITEPIQSKIIPRQPDKKLSNSSIKKSTTLNNNKHKSPQNSKKELSKKQTLDQAQKSALDSTKKKSKKEKEFDEKIAPSKLKTSQIKKVPQPVAMANSKISNSKKNASTEKNNPKKSALSTKKKETIKSISSSTKEVSTKSKTRIKKTTTKLNDLKVPEKTKKVAELSPFEEMQDIYIKDDEREKKIKKPSSVKLKKFFNAVNKKSSSQQTTTPEFQLSRSSSHKKKSPIFRRQNNQVTAKSLTQEAPQIDNSSKQSFFTNYRKKISAINFSKQNKKIKQLTKSTKETFAKLSKKKSSSLKRIRPKKDVSNPNILLSGKESPVTNTSKTVVSKVKNIIYKIITLLPPLRVKVLSFIKNITNRF